MCWVCGCVGTNEVRGWTEEREWEAAMRKEGRERDAWETMASAEIEANRQLAGQWRSSGGPWLASVYAFAERCVRAGRRGSEAGNRGPCHMGSAAVFIRRYVCGPGSSSSKDTAVWF